MTKSPFLIVEDFLSPMLCEEIVDEIGFPRASIDPETGTIKHLTLEDEEYQKLVFERLRSSINSFEEYFDFEYKGTETILFEEVPVGSNVPLHCESCEYLEGQWVKTKARDFCCVIFLSDYNEAPPFDDEFECYGGKLEFVNHKFGFNPQRGTLIMFPSDPRFVNGSSDVVAGQMNQIRIHIAAKVPWIYNPKSFPGNYTTWF